MRTLPSVSVIIPTHRRPAALKRCLAALARQTHPREMTEIIVVDDGGLDNHDVAQLVTVHGDHVRLVRQPRTGPAAARNTGAAVAIGETFAFTDDDCAPHENWLASLVQTWMTAPECMVGGTTVNDLVDDIYAATSQTLITYLYEYYNGDGCSGRFFTSNNMLVGADQFRRLGGFSTAFDRAAAEDRDLCDRWRSAGSGLISAPDAIVRHAHAMTFGSFVRQHLQYGRGAAVFHRARAARVLERIKVEPLRFYTQLAAYPLRHARGLTAWRMATLLGVAQAANVVGFLSEQLHCRRPWGPPPSRAVTALRDDLPSAVSAALRRTTSDEGES